MIEPEVVRQFLAVGQPGYVAELDPNSPSFDSNKYKMDVLNRIGARFENRFNEFQSVSQGPEDDPKNIADTNGPIFKASVTSALNAFAIDPTQKSTSDDVLNRAGAITCGGCHQFSNARKVDCVKGQPIEWPASAGFVHVAENSHAVARSNGRLSAIQSRSLEGGFLYTPLRTCSRGSGERAPFACSWKCPAGVLATARHRCPRTKGRCGT